jgi:metal-responsive CopG/Arc/MetJ family transcriptional regulator
MARKATKSKTPKMFRLNMLIEQDLVDAIDELRAQQPGLSPNRSDAIRSLLRWAIENRPKKPLRKLEE